MHDVEMGLVDISESEWPTFLYPLGTNGDEDDDRVNLFRGYMLPIVCLISKWVPQLMTDSLVGFPPNLYRSKNSLGSRGHKERSSEQVALAQYDGGDRSHHSIHMHHCEFYTSELRS
jgi:hypothetical protein